MKIPKTKNYKKFRLSVIKANKSIDFNVDGREHYVYRVTDYNRIEKRHYYGSHTPRINSKYDNLLEEFWSYKTSSELPRHEGKEIYYDYFPFFVFSEEFKYLIVNNVSE